MFSINTYPPSHWLRETNSLKTMVAHCYPQEYYVGNNVREVVDPVVNM